MALRWSQDKADILCNSGEHLLRSLGKGAIKKKLMAQELIMGVNKQKTREQMVTRGGGALTSRGRYFN